MDLISRQAAIDAVKGLPDTPNGYSDTYDKECIIGVLKDLPSVEAVPKWVPVTERPPKTGKQVLVYARSVHYALAKYDEMRVADGVYRKQWVTFDAWNPFYTIRDVIAWMPLPEPYEGEKL